MVGNKQDLEHLREVELHEGEALASQYKIAFSEVIKTLMTKFILASTVQNFNGVDEHLMLSGKYSLQQKSL